MGDLETQHDEILEKARGITTQRDAVIQEALAKRREIKDVQVSVVISAAKTICLFLGCRITNER